MKHQSNKQERHGYYVSDMTLFKDFTKTDEDLLKSCFDSIDKLFDSGYINIDLKESNLVIETNDKILFIDTDPKYFIDITKISVNNEYIFKVNAISLCQLLLSPYNNKLNSEYDICKYIFDYKNGTKHINITSLTETLEAIDKYIKKIKRTRIHVLIYDIQLFGYGRSYCKI